MRFFSVFLFSLFLSTSFLVVPAHSTPEAKMIDAVEKRGTLRVGFASFVPWAMQNKKGEFIGFEIDVASKLAKDLGVKIVFIPTKWSGIIPSLLTGQFDIIIAGMSVTPERSEKVDFTIPYDYAGMDLLANKQRAGSIKALEGFNKKEITLSARTGGSARAAIKEYLPNAQVKYFEEEAQALQDVIDGKVDAFVSSAPLPALQAAKHPDKLFRPLVDIFSKEPVGFAIKKGDPASLEILNKWIQENIDNGWLKERKEYWFGDDRWEKELQ